jgi:hypothetical protein
MPGGVGQYGFPYLIDGLREFLAFYLLHEVISQVDIYFLPTVCRTQASYRGKNETLHSFRQYAAARGFLDSTFLYP